MKLIITIDTEEDNWGQYNLTSYGMENIKKIGALQELFDQLRIKPTYLITYPVAVDEGAVNLLRPIMEDDRCEIGAHCHPWNTPPSKEERNSQNSLLCNLPFELQYQKIETLHKTIIRNFSMTPTVFRAGRWAFNNDTAQNLIQLGYKVDSSIIAFQNWEDIGGPDYSNIFPEPFVWDDKFGPLIGSNSPLLEVPGTAGFDKPNFNFQNRIWKLLGAKWARMIHLRGIFSRSQLLNKTWLSPETNDISQMIRLTNTLMQQGFGILNMFFHSTSLKAGLGPFVKTKMDERQFLKRIEDFLVFIRSKEIDSIKLSEISA